MRIEAIGEYLKEILERLNNKYRNINADFLGIEINNYSLDKMPNAPIVENWIIPVKKKQDTFLFKSRNTYGNDVANNLKNIGFWEQFESIIDNNNEKGILPNIDNIESIKCLNCGSVAVADTKSCVMTIQLQVIYRTIEEEENVSL